MKKGDNILDAKGAKKLVTLQQLGVLSMYHLDPEVH